MGREFLNLKSQIRNKKYVDGLNRIYTPKGYSIKFADFLDTLNTDNLENRIDSFFDAVINLIVGIPQQDSLYAVYIIDNKLKWRIDNFKDKENKEVIDILNQYKHGVINNLNKNYLEDLFVYIVEAKDPNYKKPNPNLEPGDFKYALAV